MNKDDPTSLDLHALDLEWQRQAIERRKAGEDLAEINNNLRRKKSYLKFRRAEIAMEYRTGKEIIVDATDKPVKLTEKAIEMVLDSSEELSKIDKEINDLIYESDIHSTFCIAMDQKKYALQEEVRLYMSDYFSEPRDPSKEKQYDGKVKKIKEDMDKEYEISKTKEARRSRRKERSNV